MGTCSLDNCNSECFEEDKCILHCDRHEKNNWHYSNEDNIKKFYMALIDYITYRVLRASKEYKLRIDPAEDIRIIIWNFLDNLDNNDKSFDIEEALKNKIILKDIIFPTYGSLNVEYNYTRVLSKLMFVEFQNCHFEDELFIDKNAKLIFSKCQFFGEWKHILYEKIKYLNCEFEDFIIDNISENKFIVEDNLLFNCGFKNIVCSGAIFKKRFFKFNNINKYKTIEKVEFTHCEFEEDFILNITNNEDEKIAEYFNITSLNLEHSTFHKKVKIQFCNIKEKASFYNTKFKDLADFYRTKFNEVNFERADFEDIAVFSEAEFYCDVDFKYVKFLKQSIFRDMVITGKLNLRNTIFDADANFLDVTSKKRIKDDETKEFIGEPKVIDVANRETARIIKNFYDNSNNIIEANKFYALEMQKRKEELTESYKINRKNRPEWLIFKLHSISSNHSQDWQLTLTWILFFSFLYSSTKVPINDVLIVLLTVSVVALLYSAKIIKIFVIVMIFIVYSSFNIDLDCVAKNINPFSIMTSWESISFDLLLFKIIIAYLIYQFIVSVRQNTRRK